MKIMRMLCGFSGPYYQGTDCAPLADEQAAAYEAAGACEPICGSDETLQRHALCQAAARLDVAITSRDADLDALAADYGVRSSLRKARG